MTCNSAVRLSYIGLEIRTVKRFLAVIMVTCLHKVIDAMNNILATRVLTCLTISWQDVVAVSVSCQTIASGGSIRSYQASGGYVGCVLSRPWVS